MAETKHTPGPWFVYEPEWARHDGGKFVASILIGKCRGTDEQEEVPQEICSVNNDSLWFTGDKSEIVGSMFEHVEADAKVYPEALANAHLIAAAPEMYEALQQIRIHATVYNPESEIQKRVVRICDESIAKAEGRNV